MHQNTYRIYKWTNIITGQCYVGQTRLSLQRRTGNKMCRYKGSSAFWEGIQAYGIHCWRLEILWDGLTEDEANFYEGLEIRDNDAMYPYGYNLEEGGENYTRSEKTKQKMSDVMKGEKNPFYGKKHSEETRQEISKNHARFWKGKKRSAESRRKMAENNPMKCPETRRKHAEAMKVRTLSEESRQKIVDAKRSPSYAPSVSGFLCITENSNTTRNTKNSY